MQLQLVSRWILPRLGFKVLKGQEDLLQPNLDATMRGMNTYLRDYSDYICRWRRKFVLVDVKAPVVLKLRHSQQAFGSTSISFSKTQWSAYGCSKLPVFVLLWEYDAFRPLIRQRERLRYAAFEFGSLKLQAELSFKVEASAKSLNLRPRWLTPNTLRKLLRRAKALGVTNIQPGRIVRTLL